jgi:hypothetical protein
VARKIASMQSCTEVRLALLAIAEDAASWGRPQAPREVEHVAVRVALAEDRDEPEDPALNAEALAVGADEASQASFDAPYSDV